MKLLRWIAMTIGYLVMAMYVLGQLSEEVNFRLCFGAAERCRFIYEGAP